MCAYAVVVVVVVALFEQNKIRKYVDDKIRIIMIFLK